MLRARADYCTTAATASPARIVGFVTGPSESRRPPSALTPPHALGNGLHRALAEDQRDELPEQWRTLTADMQRTDPPPGKLEWPG
jgi:hypothetical protein